MLPSCMRCRGQRQVDLVVVDSAVVDTLRPRHTGRNVTYSCKSVN